MSLAVASPRSTVAHSQRRRSTSTAVQPERVQAREAAALSGEDALACYTRSDGRLRQIVARPGARRSVLVIDRDAVTLGDRRLVAHLAPDEPQENAEVVCAQYIADVHGRWCRRVSSEDLRDVPAHGAAAVAAATDVGAGTAELETGRELQDAAGRSYRLELVGTERSASELRWCMRSAAGEPPVVLSLREIVGRLERYEPARTISALALLAHRDDRAVSVCTLAVELDRVAASSTVLNRGLREAVLAAIARDEQLSMSEIALRCGREKRDRRGVSSGETTWLARRLGLASDGMTGAPTPWVHCDVLALIARNGLGVAPREVEVA